MQASGTDIRHFYTAPGTPPSAMINVGVALLPDEDPTPDLQHSRLKQSNSSGSPTEPGAVEVFKVTWDIAEDVSVLK